MAPNAPADRFTAVLWQSDDPSPWFFVSLPVDLAEDIAAASGPRKAFGSVPVWVTVGASSWATSLFPDKGRGTYVLPVKKAIRAAEGLEPGELIAVAVTVVVGERPAAT